MRTYYVEDYIALKLTQLCLNAKTKKETMKYYVKFCRYLYFFERLSRAEKRKLIQSILFRIKCKKYYSFPELYCEEMFSNF